MARLSRFPRGHLGRMAGMIRQRTAITALSISAAAMVGLVMHEGYSDEAIIPVAGDVPTIGFGTTAGVKLGDKTTPPAALARALRDVQVKEGALKACISVPLAQCEYDAYIDLAYNIGEGAFCRSTIVKRLNAGDYRGACEAILMWRMFQGNDCSLPENKRRCGGLWTRRQTEYRQCLGESTP